MRKCTVGQVIGLLLLADAQSSTAETVGHTPRFVHYCSTMFCELLILCHFVVGARRVQGEDVIRSAQVLVLPDPIVAVCLNSVF